MAIHTTCVSTVWRRILRVCPLPVPCTHTHVIDCRFLALTYHQCTNYNKYWFFLFSPLFALCLLRTKITKQNIYGIYTKTEFDWNWLFERLWKVTTRDIWESRICSTIVTYSILICATKNAHAFLYVHSLLSAIDNHWFGIESCKTFNLWPLRLTTIVNK